VKGLIPDNLLSKYQGGDLPSTMLAQVIRGGGMIAPKRSPGYAAQAFWQWTEGVGGNLLPDLQQRKSF
jgi:hypothetical protein